MPITAPVGRGATNARGDVLAVQVLLNLNRPAEAAPVAVDGGYGEQTGRAIAAFQARALGTAAPDGRIDPGGRTLRQLRAGIPAGLLDTAILRAIMPAASPARIETYLPHLRSGMAARAIDTPLRRAHFIAQLAHESGAFRYAEELADGAAYEGRADLGNNRPGDGRRFKGRGLIQLTGRANYTAYGTAIGRDLAADPAPVATDPALAVDAACWFWATRGLNALADADDVERITRRINGGLNGFEDRRDYLRRAKFFLGA
jgi:putative chitinase